MRNYVAFYSLLTNEVGMRFSKMKDTVNVMKFLKILAKESQCCRKDNLALHNVYTAFFLSYVPTFKTKGPNGGHVVSIVRVAEDLNMHRSKAERRVKILAKYGIIKVHRERGPTKRWLPTEICIDPVVYKLISRQLKPCHTRVIKQWVADNNLVAEIGAL